MKYWLLTTEFPPFFGGGIGTYCDHTAQMLAQNGYEVTVFVSDRNISTRSYSTAKGIRIIRFNHIKESNFFCLGDTAQLSYAFANIVKDIIQQEGKPDIIEAQDYLGIAYYLTQFKGMQYEYIQNVPIVLTLHAPAFIYLEYNRVPVYRFPEFWTCEMEKQTIVAADLLISPSNFIGEEIQKRIDINEKNIHVVPNPFNFSLKNISFNYTPNEIVCYGKLSPQKGSFKVLEYFSKFWESGSKLTLRFIGGTDIVYHPERQTMGQLIQEKYQDYISRGLIVLQDKIQPELLGKYLEKAHVVLFPSIIDNLPYAVIEVMSLGKVVLASRQGGQREIIVDGENGFLFDHEQPDTFQTQLEKILSLNEEELARIGRNAIERIQQTYSYQNILSQKQSVLEIAKLNPENCNFPFLYQEPVKTTLENIEGVLLSVVIPYYNMGDYIEECVQSVLDSNYTDIEIIIINDGSNNQNDIDKLKAVERMGKVMIVNNPNRGLAATRNEGASIAKGRYLAFLDADDKVHPTYYEKAIRVLDKNTNVYFVGSWVNYFENTNRIWAAYTPQPPYCLVHNSINSSGLVYKRVAFLNSGFNDKNLDFGLEDFDSVIGMLSAGFNGIALPEPLFYYRVRSNSMFRKINQEKFLYSYKYISEKHRNYYKTFATEVFQIVNANGPAYLFDNPTISTIENFGYLSGLFRLLKSLANKNPRFKRLGLSLLKLLNK